MGVILFFCVPAWWTQWNMSKSPQIIHWKLKCWGFATKTKCTVMSDPWKWIKADNIRAGGTFTQLTFTRLNYICFVATRWSDWVWSHCWQTFQAGFALQALQASVITHRSSHISQLLEEVIKWNKEEINGSAPNMT